MLRFCAVLTLVLVYLSSGHEMPGDKNTKWRENDLMLSNMENFYKILAITTRDANDRSKRFGSVLSLALMYYGSSKKLSDLERVRDAIAKTKRQLNQPADAIAGLHRAYIILLRVVIDKQINDIKACCTPDTEETACITKLHQNQERDEAQCDHYSRSLAMYETSKNFYTSPEYADFFHDIKKITNNEDLVALSFFTNSMLVDYPSIGRQWRNVYQQLTNTTYPCNIGNLPFFS